MQLTITIDVDGKAFVPSTPDFPGNPRRFSGQVMADLLRAFADQIDGWNIADNNPMVLPKVDNLIVGRAIIKAKPDSQFRR